MVPTRPDYRCAGHRIFIAMLLITIVALVSCRTTGSLRNQIETMPAKNLEYYAFSPDSRLIERLNVSSKVVMHYLEAYETSAGDLSLYELSGEERSLLAECLELLPRHYRSVLRERLIGIYFVENITATGIADYVLSGNDEIYSILILNPISLRMSISELLTYKDDTNFSFGDDTYELEIEVSGGHPGLLYILAHECTHIVDYVDHVTPYVEPNMLSLFGTSKGNTDFTNECWSGYYDPKTPLTYRERLKFYWTQEDERIPSVELPHVYAELETSPFVSLYSYLSWAEDLAEYCAMYHLTQNLGLTYSISLMREGVPLFEYRPFDNPLVLGRAAHLGFLP